MKSGDLIRLKGQEIDTLEKRYSVLMSVYKKENPEYLDKSIRSMMDQSVKPADFVIVKDGPLTVELDAIIDKYTALFPELFQIIALEKNGGLGPALATGIQKAKYEIVARMDSDDISAPTRCEEELAILDLYPDLGAVGTFEAEFIDNPSEVVSIHRVPEDSDSIYRFMKRRCALLHPTVMYKKDAVISSGNYHSVHLYEDYDLFARMILEHKIKSYNIQKPLYYIRISEDFYKRRGGIKYARTVLKFKYCILKKGYMSIWDFIVSGVGQAIVCILPNSVRKYIYMKLLRK